MITDFLTLELGFVLVPLTKMGMAMRTFNTEEGGRLGFEVPVGY